MRIVGHPDVASFAISWIAQDVDVVHSTAILAHAVRWVYSDSYARRLSSNYEQNDVWDVGRWAHQTPQKQAEKAGSG
jgi:hypothetical protein